MNITGDNINTVKNTDDCIVLIRDTESPTTKAKISFKSHKNHKKTQFLVGLQADLHERTELRSYTDHMFFLLDVPASFWSQTTPLILSRAYWRDTRTSWHKINTPKQLTIKTQSSDPKLEVTSFTDKYMVHDFNNLIDSLKMRSKHQELFSSRSFFLNLLLFSAVPNFLKVMHTHKPQTLFVYLNLEN